MTATLAGYGIGRSYGEVKALDEADFSVAAGRRVAVLGPSGCGKSTLLELVAGLQEPTSGRVEVDGRSEAAARLASCAWMPQKDCLLPWYSAVDNAALALLNRGTPKAEARISAASYFERFGLGGFERAKPSELSGGMRQRVAFLRTLISGKPVLLLDEPFAALDAMTRAELQEWLLPVLDDGGQTVLLVTHDVEEALYLADSVLVMSPRPGRITAEVVSPERLANRIRTVTSAGFVETREQVLAMLGSRRSSTVGRPAVTGDPE